jgi:type III restriction enzyme
VPSVVIENPVINSAFLEPTRHFRFTNDGISDEISEGRRPSEYFVPIPPPKKRGAQPTFQTEWIEERKQSAVFINQVRDRVALWRHGDHQGVTHVTRELLEHWTLPDRERRLFFCQIEALETAIYLTEIAPKHDPWIEMQLRRDNETYNPGLYRVAFKMATGSGKTLVMAMLIAWQGLNKLAQPQDPRFGDAFFVVTPGITIRERLRVLLPNAEGNYYRLHDLVTPEQHQRLNGVAIHVTNFHAFQRQETVDAAALTKKVLAGRNGDPDRFKETPGQMVRRVLRDLQGKGNIVVLNDEAHHCYRDKLADEPERLTAEERADAKKSVEAARVWLNGLLAVKKSAGIRAIYDLSATPFFLRGSGYSEGTLFPWVVSDFSLIDAIESGIVKVPRVPVSDDQMTGDSPTYRDLWPRIRDALPKKGRSVDDRQDPNLPAELEGALRALYGHYETLFKAYADAPGDHTPPVFIVVCNNTTVSKMVFDWIAGYDRTLGDGSTATASGNLRLFSNAEAGNWRDRPYTLLIDSVQLESGEAMDPAFKRAAAREIEEFKAEARISGRNPEEINDEDLLREAMNTVGKKGKLGEQLRCVVSVSMLTEGWDANTVTHILGVRAFGTQLLCEQVIGRGLRRVSYVAKDGMFEPEYADVYGVPFSFIPTAGGVVTPKPLKEQHRIYALPARAVLEITYPRVVGYRYDLPTEHLGYKFEPESNMALSTRDLPVHVRVEPIVGEGVDMSLDDLKRMRPQALAYELARRVLYWHFRDPDGNEQPWLFPQILGVTQRWLAECVTCQDDTFPQLLFISEKAQDAAERIHRAIVRESGGESRLVPILQPYEPVGSTAGVDFSTTKDVYPATKSHLNYVVLDSDWEAKLAEALERMPEVLAYVKNQSLGFQIPYTFEGGAANYRPDFVIRLDDGGANPLNLILEVTGERKKQKAAKVATVTTLWVPAVNAHGGYGRWAFLEVADPWDAANLIRATFLPQHAAREV